MKKNFYVKKDKGITLIALVVTIVVLLILAGVSIKMLGGENGIITQASDAKDKTEQARVEELVSVAIGSLIAEKQGDKSVITPEMIAEEVNKMENRTDVKSEESTFPTNIIFEAEGRKVGVDINISVTSPKEKEIYSIAGLEEEAEKNTGLFEYEIIDNAEIGATTWDSLPTKEARITGIKQIYCNSVHGGVYNPETDEYINTNYEIIYNGEKISDTLVIPYQVEIDGEMYKITEVKLSAYGYNGGSWAGYISMPKVKTIIYPNTIKEIYSNNNIKTGNGVLESAILSENLTDIGNNAFEQCIGLTSITIPDNVTSIGNSAFNGCNSLTTVNYRGTEEQWNQITIGSGNTNLTKATINYKYTGK